jgi:hypothetical protein
VDQVSVLEAGAAVWKETKAYGPLQPRGGFWGEWPG